MIPKFPMKSEVIKNQILPYSGFLIIISIPLILISIGVAIRTGPGLIEILPLRLSFGVAMRMEVTSLPQQWHQLTNSWALKPTTTFTLRPQSILGADPSQWLISKTGPIVGDMGLWLRVSLMTLQKPQNTQLTRALLPPFLPSLLHLVKFAMWSQCFFCFLFFPPHFFSYNFSLTKSL